MGDAADRGGGWDQDALGRPVVEDGAGRLRASGADRADDAKKLASVCKVPAPQTKKEIRLQGPADESYSGVPLTIIPKRERNTGSKLNFRSACSDT